MLNREQESSLAVLIKDGDVNAINTLIENNLGLSGFVAKRYVNNRNSFEDLISAGNEGLVRAARKYDGRYRFSTYAYFWIRRFILEHIGGNASDASISPATYWRVVNAKAGRKTTELFAAATRKVTRSEYARDENKPSDQMMYEEERLLAVGFLRFLDDRKASIVSMRFGLDRDKGEMTYQQIADHLGISRNRAFVLFKRAIERLKEVAGR